MKKWLCIWISAFLTGLAATAAALLLRGALGVVLCAGIAAAWGALFLRFRSISYRFDIDRIIITCGVIVRSELTIKRSDILSQSRLYLGRHLICTVVRTAGKKAVLFCDIPDIC